MNVSPATAPPAVRTYNHRAHALLWATMVFIFLGIGVGGGWDRAYHTRYPFDTFFSPPHLFIYTMFAIASGIVALLWFTRSLRESFGDGWRLSIVRSPIPGSLVLLGAGLATVGFAGMVLDNLWHTAFGLDETGWSFPHSMLGWGLWVTCLGFVSCRLSLSNIRPVAWVTAVALGWLVLAFSFTPFLGPLGKNHTPETVEAVAAIPVLQAQPEPQHTFRIYQRWNLNRTHPFFIPLSALWAGTSLAMIRGLDRRWSAFLAATFLANAFIAISDLGAARFLKVSDDLAAWAPTPIFTAALVFLGLTAAGLSERWAWPLAGSLFAALTYVVWGTRTYPFVACLALPAAIVAMPIGAWLGKRIARLLISPARGRVYRLVAIGGWIVPATTGVVDLALRVMTR